jgi:hypothetical protein
MVVPTGIRFRLCSSPRFARKIRLAALLFPYADCAMLNSVSPFRIVYDEPGFAETRVLPVATVELPRALGRVVLPPSERLGVDGVSVLPPKLGVGVGTAPPAVAEAAGMLIFAFTFSRFASIPGLAASIAFTLTLYFFAISVSMSPFWIVYVLPVVDEVAPNDDDDPNEL